MGENCMDNNIIRDKSFEFAVRIVRLYQFLAESKKEFVLSRQLLRCGTSIGANVVEALDAVSRREFINKMSISLKECSESIYWIELLYRTDYVTEPQYNSIQADSRELKRILSSIVKTTKEAR